MEKHMDATLLVRVHLNPPNIHGIGIIACLDLLRDYFTYLGTCSGVQVGVARG